MPSSKPEVKVRANESQIRAWKESAEFAGDSFNSWACDALDAQVEFQQTDSLWRQPVKPKEEKSVPVESAKKWVEKKTDSKGGCSFFTPRGTKCKVCGKVHS